MNGWLIFGLGVLVYCIVDRICECIERKKYNREKGERRCLKYNIPQKWTNG